MSKSALLTDTQTPIKFNHGQTLLHLAGTYPTLLEVILELVQNSLDRDVKANLIWITINRKTRHLAVRDNGNGATLEKFNAALASVAQPGRKGEGSLGQFGIGLISPLGKCERFTFISCPAPHKNGFQEWTFSTAHILKQRMDINIPLRARPDLTLEDKPPAGKTKVYWRSEMSLTGFTSDEYISRVPIDTLIGGIQDRYATTMRRNKTIISVEVIHKDGTVERRLNVTAQEFRGQALPVQKFVNSDSGETTFRLFIAPKVAKGRNGRVLVGVTGNDFRFPFHYLARSATQLLRDEVITALTSGLFEGEILSQKSRLHPDRKTLEKDDAFVGLCCAIEEWFDGFGSKYLDEARHSRQEQRFQELGLRSMKVLEHLFMDQAHAPLRDVIKSFGRGVAGNDHADAESTDGGSEQTTNSGNGEPGDGAKTSGTGSPNRADSSHVKKPQTGSGPKGSPRKVVKNASFGLQFAHEAMEGSPELWKLDADAGILTFNIRHPHWMACELRDSTLMKLQECVTMEALTLHMMPVAQRHHQRQAIDELNHSLVSWILNGDKVRSPLGRKPADSSSE